MAFIPPDATWYLADVVMRFTVEGEARPTVHVNLHLIRAELPDEAYAKALELGRDGEDEYVNPDGRRVRSTFVGLLGLNVVHEPLEDGAELAFTERRGLSDAEILGLARPREQLAAFRPIEPAGTQPLSASPSVLGINHAQIMIAPGEEEAVRAFYSGLLGFAEIEKPAPLKARGGFWLEAGDRQLHVGVERPGEGIDRRKTRAHVAYEVSGLEGFRARLAAAGVAILDGEPVAGLRRLELRDPAGNRVELLERA
jgi:catechol 2,3-dioxygenase-like lactoylglutathione lyase family enzyme